MSEQTKALSYFEIPNLSDVPLDIREQMISVQEKVGFIPNVFLVLAARPAECRAFFAYHDALMEKEEGLTKAEREMIVVATSAVNRCQYCVVAHGAILRIRAKKPLIADQVAINPNSADLSPREKRICEFAIKLARHPEDFGEVDVQQMRARGFTDDEIWDIGAITAFFGLSNRMASLTGMWSNPEFYGMGREPRSKK